MEPREALKDPISLPWGRFYVIIIDIDSQQTIILWVTQALRCLWSHLLHATQLAFGAKPGMWFGW